ncbi:MAG: GNAT family N-acetyltransferase [Acidimicrobiia bacterium]|nr:GNAT family N-acetyltransferase [Acidimicrobiia bacterium]
MRVEKLDLDDPTVAGRVLVLQRAAYAVEAELVGSTEIPPLTETLEDMRAAPLEWVGIRSEGRIVAAMAWRQIGDTIDIDRLIVDPEAMRRGYGSTLVLSLDLSKTITVSTGERNAPAHALYSRLGFEVTGAGEPAPGLPVRHYVRRPDGSQ